MARWHIRVVAWVLLWGCTSVWAGAPLISGSPQTTVNAGQVYQFVPTASDPDGDKLTFSIKSKPVWAAFDTKTGVLTGTPNSKQAKVYKNIAIQVSDGKEKAALTAFSITVNNSPPTISGAPLTALTVGASYHFAPSASDANGDKLTFSVAGKPKWAKFDTTTGVLSGVPTSKQAGVYKAVRIQVSDGKHKISLPDFDITVTNPLPTITGTPNTLALVGKPYHFLPTANDPNGDSLIFSIMGKPSWAKFDTKTGVLSGTPTAKQIAVSKNIIIQVSDGTSKVALPAFNLAVVAENKAPALQGTPHTQVKVDSLYRFVPIAADADNDALTFSIQNKPTWADFNNKTGELSGTPTASDVGKTNNVLIQVSDGVQQVGLPVFAIEVLADSPPPSATCHVSYKITSQWNNGFGAEVVISNLGDAWQSWTVTWDMLNGQKITELWNGSYTQTLGAVKVTNTTWNGSVAKGASTQFGFNGSHTGINAIPTNVAVNGVLCSGNAEPPPPPVGSCEVKYTLVSEWNTGYTADIEIKNTGNTVSDWIVAWDMPDTQQIIQLWNGNYTQTAQHVDVTHNGWNRIINKDASLQFGFNGSHQAINRTPGNISLNGVKCSGQVDPPPPPPPSCEVTYRIQNQWANGFTGTVDIKNTGIPWNGWQTTWTMPNGQKLTQWWSGHFAQAGDKVTVTHEDSNKVVRQGNNISFGFNASHTGINPAPIDVAVNGTRCGGQSDTVVLPPKAPSALQGTLVANNAEFSWQDNSADEANMVLERRENAGNWSVLATLPANTVTYQDSNLLVGVAYEYRVKAVNIAGVSVYSNTVSVKCRDNNDIRATMLVNNCVACHGTDGYSSGPGIPSIAGMNKDYLIRTMKAYRTGDRASSVMSRIAKGYTDTQIERMADYLAKLPYKANKQTTDAALVARGKAVHKSNCQFCHADTGNNAAFTKTLLDGQWSTYLHATLEDYYAGRNKNVPVEMANQMKNLKPLFGDDVLLALAQYYASDKTGGDSGGSGGSDPTVLPLAPSQLTATPVDNSKINLGWKDNSGNETGFRVARRDVGDTDSAWVTIAELASNAQAYADSTVVMGTAYEYRVSAFNTKGSAASGVVSAVLQTVLQYGQAEYQRQGCASCHGVDGKGGFTNLPMTKYTSSQMTALTRIIHDTMPPGNPGACQNGCASAIASYITEVLTPNANGGGGGEQACVGSPPSGVRSLRLLTRQEYQNTVNDLLGLQLDLLHKLPEENRVDGFDNNAAQNQITSLRMEAFLGQAEQLAAQAVLQSWNKLLPCTQQDAVCGRQFIQTFGKRAFRRPLATAEADAFAVNFSRMAFRDAVEKTVMGMLMSPNFLYRSELGEVQADGTYKLTSHEVASSLSYLFWGSMPDAALMQAADQNALETPQQRISQASRLLADPRSRQQVGNFVGQWLLKTNPYALPPKDGSVYPAYTDQVKLAMSQELIHFFNHVAFDSTQTFRELYEADYVTANETLAAFYHLSGVTGNSFSKVPVTDGSRHGILTLGAVLARYANSNESHPFKRGRFFFERVLCHDLPEPANMGVVEAPDPDPNMTTRERFAFHSNSGTSCFSCHQYLDGPGFNFEKYDGAGQFRQLENGSLVNAFGILRGMETFTPTEQLNVNDLAHLSQLVADSPTAAQCLAKQYYRYTTGRRETSADSCALDSYIQTYADNGYNLQTMLLGIVNAPNFTLRRAQ